ncbi:MAG: NAD-dependent epimerase/dehydratase family protein [Chloroflexota bacterium]|nr:NAD-dependent epimerase/dehydratase family protein [Chloroflexota bacterium]
MKLLILGGTVFLGRHIVEAARAHSHQVTLFNRGRDNPELFPDVEKLLGDRNGDLSALQSRHWDAVIDTSGYIPRVVRASAELLANKVDSYTFISSISAYADFSTQNIDESAPVATLEDETVEEVTNETYGALKALCEQAVEATMPGRALIIRPGLIVGPNDPTDRFTYWPYRIAQGSEMLVPGQADRQTQFIDVRDLAEWIIRMVEAHKTGVYNATGPDYALSMGQFVDTAKAVTNSATRFTWVGDIFVPDDINFQPWVPAEYAGMRDANCEKAISEGLTFRPLANTLRDTLDWKRASVTSGEMRSGIKPELEKDLLERWHNR